MPAAVALSILFVAGCNGESPQAGEQPSTTPAPPATFAPKPEDEAIKAWKTALGVTTKDPAAVAAAQGVADPKALEAIGTFLDKPTRVTSNARAVANPDGTVEIQDCGFVDPPTGTGDGALAYRALARAVNGSWRIFHAQMFGKDLGDGFKVACVPKPLNDDVLAGYGAYWEAAPKLWNDGNPDNPLLSTVTSGATRASTRTKLEDYKKRNAVLRNSPTTHPEIVQVVSPTEVVIRDCQEPDPNYGLYDRSTGTRLPDADPTPPGKRDLAEVHMMLEEGVWKFAKFAYGSGSNCQFAPTDRGVAVL